MNTAERLYWNCPKESLERAAENNSVITNRLGNFTRYIFRDESCLLFDEKQSVFIFCPDEYEDEYQ